jgi:hypothetical protein
VAIAAGSMAGLDLVLPKKKLPKPPPPPPPSKTALAAEKIGSWVACGDKFVFPIFD